MRRTFRLFTILALTLFGAALAVQGLADAGKVIRLTLGSSIARSEARQCSKCHAMEFSLWISHPHSRALLDPENDAKFIEAQFGPEAKGYSKLVKGVFGEEDVAMAFGVTRTQVFWKKGDSGHTLLPALWNMQRKRWEALPSFLTEAREAGTTWEDGCAGCHSSGFDPADDTFAAPAVSCRACHGDGTDHAKSGGLGEIVRPNALSAKSRAELCGACHARGIGSGGHPFAVGHTPGAPLGEAFTLAQPTPGENTDAFWADGTERNFGMEYQGFLKSNHYRAGLSCTTCHLPHGSDNAKGLRRHTDEICFSCHELGTTSSPVHVAHPKPEAGCVDCHMSVINPGAGHLEARTHTFNFLEPEAGLKWKMPNSCTASCHEGKDGKWALRVLEKWRN